MTLPAGQISLNDVNVELGYSGTTQISLNQSDVRTLAGVASGQISMSDLQNKSNASNFIALIAGSNGNLRSGRTSVASDSSGNIYVSYNNTDTSVPCLIKYTSTGSLVFQKSFNISGVTLDSTTSVAIDSSNNVFFVCGNSSDVYIGVLNTSGTVSTTYKLAGAGSVQVAKVSGTLLVIGTKNNGYGANFIGFNTSSGAVSWGHTYSNSSNYVSCYGMAFSPNYVYICGPAGANVWTAQVSFGGSIGWKRLVGSSGYPAGITVDSSDNVYVAQILSSGGNAYVYKYDSSYNGLASAGLSTSYWSLDSISIDSSNNIYISGNTQTVGYIAKLNSSLSVQYQRTMTPSTGYIYYGSNTIIGSKLFSSGYAQNYALTYTDYISSLFAPLDGTATGAYTVGSYTYTYASNSSSWSAGSTPSTSSYGATATITPTVTTVTGTTSNTSNTSTIKVL